MSSDYITIFAFLFFLIILSFFFFKTYRYQIEGMTNNDNNDKVNTAHGINSSKLTDQLKIEHNNMKDKLNIKQYRNNYENVVIDMNDYLDGLMLNELLSLNHNSLDPNNILSTVENINKMSSGKQNLNKIMKYLDEN
jgi:hypothetical protein